MSRWLRYCADMAADHSPRFLRLSERARAEIVEISASDFEQELSTRQSVLLSGRDPSPLYFLDVREDHEWLAERIPGATHLGRGILERDIEKLAPDPETEIVLYCGGGYRSALATAALGQMGYTRVRSLAGGFRGWKESGRPTVLGEPQPELSHFRHHHTEGQTMTPKHIIVATDLTELSLPAVQMAKSLAQPLGSRITLVHVLEPAPTPPGLEAFALEGMPLDWEERLLHGRSEAASQRLADIAAAESTPKVQVHWRLLQGRMPDAMIEEVKALEGDLLIVGTHGRKGVSHFLLGSVAEKLMRGATCPVLVVRPTAS
jgi:nucleotide-binding universal stress UspA family protein/rhodanese-related sulfurtransferase